MCKYNTKAIFLFGPTASGKTNISLNIAKKFPDWKFHLIGSHRLGENRNTKPFTNKMVERFKKIGNQALFHGFKDQDFVQQKMKTASINIIPSIWEEPFGLVAAEAMSNGIAIIASHVGGIPEIVKDNGVLIKDINTKLLNKKFCLKFDDKFACMLQHPVTTENKSSEFQISQTLKALKLSKIPTFIILPNNDSG